jgi:transcriptional regulator with XRE-family HTH domain
MTMSIKTGEELKAERKKLGLSAERLARLCDVSRGTIANWEKTNKLPFILGLGLTEFIWSLNLAKEGRNSDEK